FQNNVCSMKGFAAWDLEDILQCIIPCIERLLPPMMDTIVLDLLFDLGTWHVLAKMRMHTNFSLDVFEVIMCQVGSLLRKFKEDVCRN
ncbi:hypothetical protein C8J56DRAFT_795205, partial [Mycena floridula]